MQKICYITTILVGLAEVSLQFDPCSQLITHERCIGDLYNQCSWNRMLLQCRKSNNYLQGCQNTLSLKLCVKQLGNIFGEVSACIFTQYCQSITNFDAVKCSDQLSKSGCLGITNPTQLCKWESGRCQYLSTPELVYLQSNFPDWEISASVCPSIKGYLIVHSSKLWQLTGYQPDLTTEASQQVALENEGTTTTKSYKSNMLKNNFINDEGEFVWYSTDIKTKDVASDLKLNDQSRYGCIAVELSSYEQFIKLFSFSGEVNSVNHVYCKYLEAHPTEAHLAFFSGKGCVEVSEQLLKDDSYIRKNQIRCQDLGQKSCFLIVSETHKCKFSSERQEFLCVTATDLTPTELCKSMAAFDMHHDCSTSISPGCYYEVQNHKGRCVQGCFAHDNQQICQANQNCFWDLDAPISCSPKQGCAQLGLNRAYCLGIKYACYWNEKRQQCELFQDLHTLKCKDAITQSTCLEVTLEGQLCVWTNQCISVRETNFAILHGFFIATKMNRSQCLQQKQQFYYYSETENACQIKNDELEQCQNLLEVQTEGPCTSPSMQNASKYYCLNQKSSFTKWDQYQQLCINLLESKIAKTPCEQYKVANILVCRKAQNLDSSTVCVQDPESYDCVLKKKSELQQSCSEPLLDEIMCGQVINTGEFCQYSAGRCRHVGFANIQQELCSNLIRVNPNVCAAFFREEPCIYDSKYRKCRLSSTGQPSCYRYMNPRACELSSGACYYDFLVHGCFDSLAILSTVKCSGAYLTELSCKGVTAKAQPCYWNVEVKKCLEFTSLARAGCSQYTSYNLLTCARLSTDIDLLVADNGYCELNGSVCEVKITEIIDPGCGNDRSINLNRCRSHTNSNNQECYFSDYQCTKVSAISQQRQYLLAKLRCEEVNLNLCTHITNATQVCLKDVTLKKCRKIKEIGSKNCLEVSALMAEHLYNGNVCGLSLGGCRLNVVENTCVETELEMLYDCETPGLSQSSCIAQTIGLCVFQLTFCRKMTDLNVPCQFRNKAACSQGGYQCIWVSWKDACECSLGSVEWNCPRKRSTCPTSYVDYSLDWLTCSQVSSSEQYCFASYRQCSQQELKNLPCWASLNRLLCLLQSTYCNWIDNRCREFDSRLTCETAKSFEECILNPNRSQKCVYHNQICFQPKTGHSCSDFDYTSYQYCRQFEECLYTSENKCLNLFIQDSLLNQFISNQSSIMAKCEDFKTKFDCLFQKQLNCNYVDSQKVCIATLIDSVCSPVSSTDIKSLSILSCTLSPNKCRFGTTFLGSTFCYIDQLSCSQLQGSLCLSDIQNLSCFINHLNNSCEQSTFSNCEEIRGYQVNFQACLLAAKGGNDCLYDDESKQCKPALFSNVIECSAAVDIYDCTFATNLSCLLIFTDDVFTSCQTYTGDYVQTNQEWINFYGCTRIQLISTYFDFSIYKCQQLQEESSLYQMRNQLLQLATCRQANKVTCLKWTGEVSLSCVWDSHECRQLLENDELISCTNRNKQSCLRANALNCIWLDYQCSPLSADNVQNLGSLASPGYCQAKNQLISQTFQCYTDSDTPVFLQCLGLGLSKAQCISNTSNLYCYWNGSFCANANPYMLNCTQEVNEKTCLAIKTPNQSCQWNGFRCIQAVGTKCEDFSLNEIACLRCNFACYYDNATQLCREVTARVEKCLNGFSRQSCSRVKNSICVISNGICADWKPNIISCEEIVNKDGCYSVRLTCIWKEVEGCQNMTYGNKPKCSELPFGLNRMSCKLLSSDPCDLDEITLRCTQAVNLTEDTLVFSNNPIDLVPKDCDQHQKKTDCIEFRSQTGCQWDRILNKCTKSNTITCENQNMHGCVNSISKCAWRDEQCLDWIYNEASTGLTFKQTTMVSNPVCASLPSNLLAKYDALKFSCVQVNLKSDHCSLVYTQTACVSIQAFACIFQANKCMELQTFERTNCKDYKDVSFLACQKMIKLACKYDKLTAQCMASEISDPCETLGLSEAGCLKVTQQACEWNGQSCQKFQLVQMVNQCDMKTRRSPTSCSQISYLRQPCSHNQSDGVCEPKFNRFSLCSTPGLNIHACARIERQPCQFIDQKCQLFEATETKCVSVSNVNEFACRIIEKDQCIYDSISYNCRNIDSSSICSSPGFSKGACIKSPSCYWDGESSSCSCQESFQKDLCSLNKEDCNKSQACVYRAEACVKKECDFLLNCEGQLNGKVCYANRDNLCLGAMVCEDIVNLNPDSQCSDFTFNGNQCIQNNDDCVSANNLEVLCSGQDCPVTSCIQKTGSCRPIICQDLINADCYLSKGCAIIEEICQEVQNCSQIHNYEDCIMASVDNLRCNWQEVGIYDTSFWCTNQYCSFFGSSISYCQNNEINGRTCVLTASQQCLSCEQLNNKCECLAMENSCVYVDGSCKSILCETFIMQECSKSNRCYWSQSDKICRKQCIKNIREEECLNLKTECHWNQFTKVCMNGEKIIPDLSVKIDVPIISGAVFWLLMFPNYLLILQ